MEQQILPGIHDITADACSHVDTYQLKPAVSFFPICRNGTTSREVPPQRYQPQDTDSALRSYLDALSESETEYWAFRNRAAREHAHSYFQYPAMMVPQMQAKLIWAVQQAKPDTSSVYDPFMGSGTVLGEAMMQGLAFGGRDINPLAVLLCRAKTGPFHVGDACSKAEELSARIKTDAKSEIAIDFPNRDKWFRTDVSIALSKIRRAIISECDLWFRQFLWIALAETVRLTSNSRTSTYKLHTRPVKEIAERDLDPLTLFTSILTRNLGNMNLQHSLLEKGELLKEGCYSKQITIRHDDARTPLVDIDSQVSEAYDLLVTSPPYGDNNSTVPYGQHSYLPLQWIDLADIDETVDASWLSTTLEIDRRSLGGVKLNAVKLAEPLKEKSKSFIRILEELKFEKQDRSVRVAAFCHDLDACLDPILAALKPGAYMIWTIGNRSVGKRRVPLDMILSELLLARGVAQIHTIPRTIPTKRQAEKNSYAQTMSTETILVMRKGGT